VTVTEKGLTPLDPRGGCAPAPAPAANAVNCTADEAFANVTADLGAGNDAFALSDNGQPIGAVVSGGLGDDVLTGGSSKDTLSGDAGNDVLDGGSGGDELRGGPGTDLADYGGHREPVTLALVAGNGAHSAGGSTEDKGCPQLSEGVAKPCTSGAGDVLQDVENVAGGSGDDKLAGSSGDNLLSGGPGNDRLTGGSGRDTLAGEAGDDILDGGADADALLGGAGSDGLTGGSGRDVLKGGAGPDTISARDSTTDQIGCGSGKERKVTVDTKDKVASDCENVSKA
jgi:Ca2+-binding RTX toxin-like protein